MLAVAVVIIIFYGRCELPRQLCAGSDQDVCDESPRVCQGLPRQHCRRRPARQRRAAHRPARSRLTALPLPVRHAAARHVTLPFQSWQQLWHDGRYEVSAAYLCSVFDPILISLQVCCKPLAHQPSRRHSHPHARVSMIASSLPCRYTALFCSYLCRGLSRFAGFFIRDSFAIAVSGVGRARSTSKSTHRHCKSPKPSSHGSCMAPPFGRLLSLSEPCR